MAAVEAESVPAVAVRGAAGGPVWILGNWIGPVIQQYPGNFAGPGWGDTAADHTVIGLTVERRLENRVAETVEILGMDQAVAPVTVAACVAADRVGLLGHVQQLVEGAVVLGKETGHPVVLVEIGSRGFAAGLDEQPGQVGHNTESDPGDHRLLVPVVHKNPSKKNKQIFKS